MGGDVTGVDISADGQYIVVSSHTGQDGIVVLKEVVEHHFGKRLIILLMCPCQLMVNTLLQVLLQETLMEIAKLNCMKQ